MAEGSIDVLMRVVKGSALPGESNTVFQSSTAKDELQKDYAPGFFCELREFSFSAGLASRPGREEGDKKQEEAKKQEAEKAAGSGTAPTAGKPGASMATSTVTPLTEFQAVAELRRRRVDANIKRAGGDFIDMQPISFTRLMDAMSPLLFQSLVACDTLDSVSVVKRKAGGASQSGECYLRLDFEKVLLIDLDWEDSDHLIMESGTFIYRKVTIRYRPQRPDGSLGTVVQSSWEMKKA